MNTHTHQLQHVQEEADRIRTGVRCEAVQGLLVEPEQRPDVLEVGHHHHRLQLGVAAGSKQLGSALVDAPATTKPRVSTAKLHSLLMQGQTTLISAASYNTCNSYAAATNSVPASNLLLELKHHAQSGPWDL
jgi:hypothetical protein